MFRIGIIGTENSHAMAFARLFNLPGESTENYEDIRVTVLMGDDRAASEAIVQAAGVEVIAEDIEEFCRHADAAMITCRKGSLHARYALELIKRGMPLFIDKPFTSDSGEAKEIIALARAKKVPLCGGSGCIYAPGVVEMAEKVRELRARKALVSAGLNYAADTQSIYDGFFFYAPHLTQIALTIFGEDLLGVTAFEHDGSVTALARYADCSVALHYVRNSFSATGTLYTTEGSFYQPLDMNGIYDREAMNFAQMLRTGQMHQTYECLILPVSVIEAILRSIREGREIKGPF